MKAVWKCALGACCALWVLLSGGSAFAGTVTWVPDADGLWTTATNWSSTPALPGAGDDVTISPPGDRLITLSGGSTQTIKSLLANDRLTINSSTLVVGTTAQINNTLTLTSNGTLRGGVYTIAGGTSLVASDGILNGVTVNGAVDMTSVNGAQLDVFNGLTLNGTMSVGKTDGSTYAQVYFGASGVASGAMAGTGTIVLGGYGNNNTVYNYSDLGGADGTLTLGSGITIRGKSGQIINRTSAGTIVNQGTISADVAGGTINLGGAGTVVNQGTLSALNGATLNLNGAWSSTGTVTLGTGSTLNLGGSFTQAGMGTFNRTGGTVNLNGTLT